MKVIFLGTRGGIKSKSVRHRMHTSTMVLHRGRKVVIDCGEDWFGRIMNLEPDAIVITHSHPDHAYGLKAGSPCPVYATAQAWEKMKNFPIQKEFRKVLHPHRPERISGVLWEAFPVNHSLHAPAVGYRISTGKGGFFYAPDVLRIPNLSEAFSDIRVYIGDGATLTRSLIRHEKWTRRLIGHASIEMQLRWCRAQGVSRMIVTHCGSAIVGSDEKQVTPKVQSLGRKRGVRIDIAYDGMELRL